MSVPKTPRQSSLAAQKNSRSRSSTTNFPTKDSANPASDPLMRWMAPLYDRAGVRFQPKRPEPTPPMACEVRVQRQAPEERSPPSHGSDPVAQFHKVLQILFNLNPVQLYRFFQTPMGAELTDRLLTFVRANRKAGDRPSDSDTEDSVTASHASPSESLQKNGTLKRLRRLFANIQVDTAWIRAAVDRFERLQHATTIALDAVSQLAIAEATSAPTCDFSRLLEIRCPGGYGMSQQILELRDPSRDRALQTVLYLPQPWRPGKTPTIVISHGLGSGPQDYREYAEHLTSHGFAVVLPRHPGSDAAQIEAMLAGRVREVFQLQEFLDRPLDISYVLDELKHRNPVEYDNRLDLTAVGAIGHSFGAYTVLALAGAEITFPKLEQACGPIIDAPNLSLLLQCRALALPHQAYNLRDDRIQAILPIDPIGSEVFGPEGLGQIQIPVAILAGSEDATAPVALEQIRIFPWLQTRDRYLGLIEGKAHFGNFSTLETGLKAMLLDVLPSVIGPDVTLFCDYAYAISTAFFKVYLAQDLTYLPYLQSAYAAYIARAPYAFHWLSAASTDGLSRAIAAMETQFQQLTFAGARHVTP